MADAVLQILIENLNTFIQNQIGLVWGFQKEMEKLSSKLSTIHAVLEDAETKQLRDKAIKIWLRKLKSAAYEVEDILDDCATEALGLKFQTKSSRLRSFSGKVMLSSFLCCYLPPNVIFRYKMGSRIKEITEHLDAIVEERVKFHLNETVVGRRDDASDKRQTSSFITEQYVYGREDDQEKIVQLLVDPQQVRDDLSVLPILGMGGLGKTTLAQLIFNDERVAHHFEPRIWICVSENFDVKKLLKAILESSTGSKCEVVELDHLQKRTRELLNGKRYLLVLDDVWNDNQEDWSRLKYVLACGSAGTFIITTTRLQTVASIMGTVPAYSLTKLSDDNCWLLFKQRAFPQDIDPSPNFVKIGKEMVKKCKGVPLAAKSLGGLMRFKTELTDWIFVKKSEIWNLPQDDNSILPALRLSYNNLMPNTKRCFAYCAIFPKNYIMDKKNLINHWMANGFISSYGKLEMEEKGREIWNELYWSSFFQDLEKDELRNITRFKMHDLVHDLAQSVLADECFIMNDVGKSEDLMNKNVHHLTASIGNVSNKVQSLRSIIILNNIKFDHIGALDFKDLGSLRVLQLNYSHFDTIDLSSSIENLRKLRYLKLSNCINLKVLPESICNMWNLQTLNLNGCWQLKTLPKRMRCLRNLRHLYLEYCSLKEMPPKIRQLTCLKTLSVFVVGEQADNSLSELGMLNLGGSLAIRNLEQVRNREDAKEANLILKQNLRCLRLYWEVEEDDESLLHSEEEKAEQVLEALEPCPNHLRELEIINYRGTRFPRWMAIKRDDYSTTLQNIVRMKLYGCRNCLQLPQSIGRLPKLRFLNIRRMNRLEYLLETTTTSSSSSSAGDDDDGDGAEAKSLFPSLEELRISGLPNLRGLILLRRRELHTDNNKCNDDDDDESSGMMIFALLHSMEITYCPKLLELPPPPSPSSLKALTLHGKFDEVLLSSSIPKLTALTHLEINNVNEELICLPEDMFLNLTHLRSLSISGFRELPRTDQVNLSALQFLTIWRCHSLGSLSEQELQGLHSLRKLDINGCKDLKSITDEGGIRHLNSLEKLVIYSCPDLVSLLDGDGDGGMEHLKSLQILQISCCPKITSLPASIQSLTNLSSLSIFHCPLLTNRCQRDEKEWPKISHIPQLHLFD